MQSDEVKSIAILEEKIKNLQRLLSARDSEIAVKDSQIAKLLKVKLV